MRGRVAPIALVAILLVPTSAAWGGGDVVGLGARDAQLFGEAFALKVIGPDSDLDSESPAVVGLRVVAEELLVETRSRHDDVFVAAGSVSPPDYDTEQDPWKNAVAQVGAARDGPRLFFAGDGDVQLDAPRVSLQAHEQERVEETRSFPHDRPFANRSVVGAHAIIGTDAVLRVSGDFVISFYNWDVRVHNRTDDRTYTTGLVVTGPAAPNVGQSDDQRVYLFVTNGTLFLPLTGIDVSDFYVSSTTLSATSAVLDVAGQRTPLNLGGPLSLSLGPVVDGVFDATLVQEAPAVVEPGSEPPLPAPSEPTFAPSTVATNEASPWSLWWLAVPAAVVIAVLAARRASRLVALRRLMQAGEYGAVAASEGLEGSRAFGAEVVLARVVALLKTEDLDGAAALLERRDGRLLPSVSAYLWACVHAGRGDVEEARSCVIKTIVADPSMAIEVASNGKLRGFLAELDWEGYS